MDGGFICVSLYSYLLGLIIIALAILCSLVFLIWSFYQYQGFVEQSEKKGSPSQNKAEDQKSPTAVCDSKKDVSVENESKDSNPSPIMNGHISNLKARSFTFQELADATDDFSSSCCLKKYNGFGKVYKGRLVDTNEVFVIKKLIGTFPFKPINELAADVLRLMQADHPNLVKVIGYCCSEGRMRHMVFEYIPSSVSLENLLLDVRFDGKVLNWNTRMKIAVEVAQGLEYLHDKMEPPILYRELEPSHILLSEGYHPKLCNFGLAMIEPTLEYGMSPRMLGNSHYNGPDYRLTGQVTLKADVYCFGVVLLEIITGRMAFDFTKCPEEKDLVAWARLQFKNEMALLKMADPTLGGRYPKKALLEAFAIAAQCLEEQPSLRPNIADVVASLQNVASQEYDPKTCIALSNGAQCGLNQEMAKARNEAEDQRIDTC